ncbi:MAG TPA: pitrilysin family protein [Candidatus Saccharimonadales bacterium]|nr:pitrilysin family protein [Candidatus Saccharimonadales bacterium]
MKHTVSEVSLKNGTKGLFIHVPDATVMTFEVNFRAGEYLVEREKWEAPHIMEHVLLGANQLIPKARAFQAEFEKNGAYCNASTSTYDITYEAECADFEWDRIADLLITAITKPLFLDEEFEAEFGNVREELNARSNNHFRHLSLALREAYGFKSLTDQQRLELMDNVSISDIRQHYENTHTTKNLRFIIAGQLPLSRRQAIKTMLESLELPTGTERLALPIEKPKRLKSPLYISNDTVKNIYFFLDTFLLKRMNEAETDALSLINTMLTETLYSRILGTARERGLVYHMSSGIGQTRNSSNWWFGAQIMPKNINALFDIINTELESIFADNVLEADIAAAKQYALGRFQRGAQTVQGTAGGYSWRYFFDGKIDDYYKVPERIEAISKEAVVKVTRSLFKDNVWGLGVLGNCGEDLAKELYKQIAPLWS